MTYTYKVGEHVIHLYHGICKIDKIGSEDFYGEIREYYYLHPVFGSSGSMIIKIPCTDNQYLEKLLTKKEIDKLLKEIRNAPDKWNDNPLKRNQEFKEFFINKNYVAIGAIIRTIKNRKDSTKKISETDKRIMETAKLLIYGIIALGIGIKYEDCETYFFKKIS